MRTLTSENLPITLVVVLALSGCAPRDIKSVAGTYVAKYSFGTEKLSLQENNWYRQELILADGSTRYQNEGIWEWRCQKSLIILHNAMIVADDNGKLSATFRDSRTAWILHIQNIPFLETSIPINEDLGLYFVKVKPKD